VGMSEIVSRHVSLQIDANNVWDRNTWMNDMVDWAVDNGICIIWEGEHSVYRDGKLSYEAEFEIRDTEQNINWFLLRWS
jgi:hypothetical protein